MSPLARATLKPGPRSSPRRPHLIRIVLAQALAVALCGLVPAYAAALVQMPSPGAMIHGTELDFGGTRSFGHAVALSGDGQIALVGSPGDGEWAGAAYTFKKQSGKWLDKRRDTPRTHASSIALPEPARGVSPGTTRTARDTRQAEDLTATDGAYNPAEQKAEWRKGRE